MLELSKLRRPSGFTLLELIVVLAVFSIFAAMAYGGLNYVLNTRRQIESRLARTAEWQKAFQRLRNDFQAASTRDARNGFGIATPALVFEEFGRRVEFTRAGWRNPLLAPRASLERVVYRYDEKEHQLLRETWHVLDRAQDDNSYKLVVLGGIDEISWRFMDASREWQINWPVQVSSGPAPGPAGPANPLPRAVELTLKSKDYTEVRWLFRLGSGN